jgi:hypothetical protein
MLSPWQLCSHCSLQLKDLIESLTEHPVTAYAELLLPLYLILVTSFFSSLSVILSLPAIHFITEDAFTGSGAHSMTLCKNAGATVPLAMLWLLHVYMLPGKHVYHDITQQQTSHTYWFYTSCHIIFSITNINSKQMEHYLGGQSFETINMTRATNGLKNRALTSVTAYKNTLCNMTNVSVSMRITHRISPLFHINSTEMWHYKPNLNAKWFL